MWLSGSFEHPHAHASLCVNGYVKVYPNAAVIVVKMAEEEAERECNTREVIVALRKRFQELITRLKESSETPLDASSSFCQEFCQVCNISLNATQPAGFLIDDVALS